MAINTLTPTIRICVSDSCSTLKVYDTTGAEATANAGGWGATNTMPANITAAELTYTVPGGTAVTVDVLTLVNAQATVSGEFLIAEIDITPTDGSYSFQYSLTEGANTVAKRTSIYSLCVVRCCIDKLWAKAALGLMEEDCNCIDNESSYTNKAMLAEATYRAILSGTSCNNVNAREALLQKLQRICKLENCNCN